VDTELTHEYLQWLLDYNPETGRFIWKNSRRPGHNGKVAGKIGPSGTFNYAVIGIRFNGKDRNYGISRLAWFYVHGVWPSGQVKFLNGDPSDARIANLKDSVAQKRYKQGKPSRDRLLPTFKQSRYGISPQKYAEMLASQKGVCAICEKPETRILRGVVQILCIDHDHETGKVRELLCNACNAGIGLLKDNPTLMIKAAGYIRRHAGDDSNNVVPLKLVASGDGQ
jgi:hypothetical protein